MSKIRVGIVGYGLSGETFHAPLLKSLHDFEIAGVVTSRADRVQATLPGISVEASPQELCSNPDIDLVVVTYPNQDHHAIAKSALESGKHVVVEKPFTVHVEEADQLIGLAAERNLLLSVFQNRRWDGDYLTVKKLIDDGALGTVYTYEAHYDRFSPDVRPRWQEQNLAGSGTLYNLGSHLIDQALFLFGLPETVSADVFSQRSTTAAPDYFHIVLGYPVLRAVLHSGYMVAKPGPHFAVHGDKGSFLKYGMDPQEDQLKAGLRPGEPNWGEDDPHCYGELTTVNGASTETNRIATQPGCYEQFYKGMATALRGAGPVPVNARDARNVIQVIEYAVASSRDGRVITCEWEA